MDVRRRPVLLTLALTVLAAGPALYAAAAPSGPSAANPSLAGTVSGTDIKHHHIGVKVTTGAAKYKGKTITVVLHSTKVTRLGKTVTPAAIKRLDRVTITYTVNPKTHAVTAIKIVDTGPKPKPVPTPTPTPTPTQTSFTLHMADYTFDKPSLTVPVGATVTAVDSSGFHTWTSNTGAWDSGQMISGQSFSFTFHSAGDFAYMCSNHADKGMTGVIHVTG